MNALLFESALRLVLVIVAEYSRHQKHQRDRHECPGTDDKGESVRG